MTIQKVWVENDPGSTKRGWNIEVQRRLTARQAFSEGKQNGAKWSVSKAGRWYQKIGAQVNLDQIDPENDDGEIRFSIWAAKKCAQAF